MRLRILPILLAMLLLVNCIDSTPDEASISVTSRETLLCRDDEARIFLLSKNDDEDGDGIIRDEDFPTINDEDDDIADHAWIRDDAGVYHLFFQNEGVFTGGSDIEHYTTTDLRRMDYVGLALQRDPGGWDSHGLWAPHVVRSGDTYWMLYTGVAGTGATSKQRVGLATSTDLTNWTRYPVNNCLGAPGQGCVYECDESWTTWGEPNESYNQQCRDPFVIWDYDNERWLMFNTAKSTNLFGVVVVAYSTDLINWTGAGFIDATRRLFSGTGAQTTGGQCENPFVMTHDGTHYLLFSDWWDPEDFPTVPNPRTMVQYATSSNLEVDTLGSAGWTYRGSIPDPGVNAIEVQVIDGDKWIMTQSISNERAGDHDTHRRDLRLKCIVWGSNYEFDTSNAAYPYPGRRYNSNPVSPHVDRGGP